MRCACGTRLGRRLDGLVVRQERRGKRDAHRLVQDAIVLTCVCPTCGTVWALPAALRAGVRAAVAAVLAASLAAAA